MRQMFGDVYLPAMLKQQGKLRPGCQLGLCWDFQEMSQQYANKPAADQLTVHIRTLTALLISPPCGKQGQIPPYRCSAGIFLLIHTSICHHFTFE